MRLVGFHCITALFPNDDHNYYAQAWIFYFSVYGNEIALKYLYYNEAIGAFV